jgi:hypothetical protein
MKKQDYEQKERIKPAMRTSGIWTTRSLDGRLSLNTSVSGAPRRQHMPISIIGGVERRNVGHEAITHEYHLSHGPSDGRGIYVPICPTETQTRFHVINRIKITATWVPQQIFPQSQTTTDTTLLEVGITALNLYCNSSKAD